MIRSAVQTRTLTRRFGELGAVDRIEPSVDSGSDAQAFASLPAYAA